MLAFVKKLDSVLGLFYPPESKASEGIDEAEIEKLINDRNKARAEKDFARADSIRDELLEKGITLEDGPGGTTWKIE